MLAVLSQTLQPARSNKFTPTAELLSLKIS